ncbi:unnamed protein product [Phytophthora fragariaefolia]|uniref:Unnamed protein product n=1 Tax=Phytophthora fragariaefolia TaxID=1490495 RepID=A0A9W6YJE9_9STRA|nr:unnamed protein product [Phytophthora fragariaefolia]
MTWSGSINVNFGNIMLVVVPPNTHLFQPLDIAVFATLKNEIRNLISELVEEDDSGCYNLSKDDAIVMASMAWRGSKIGSNVQKGFKACDLYPLSLVKTTSRLSTFVRNGVPRHAHLAAWIHMQTLVQEEILTIPAPPHQDSTRKRKRVSVGGRLLTHEVLQEIEADQATGIRAKRRKVKHALRCNPTGHDIVESVLV